MKKLINWQQLFCQINTPLETLNEYFGVEVLVKRDDLNHNVVQGNKLRKLKYNIKVAIQENHSGIITFGGAWSNHIIASAKAAAICGIKCTGFIRGHELSHHQEKWSTTLRQAANYGMKLVFINRQEYRLKETGITVKEFLKETGKNWSIIPEGGSNSLAVQGVSEVIDELAEQIEEPTHIVTACGTAGTLAGLIDGVAKHRWKTEVVGIPVLKGADFIFEGTKKLSQYYGRVNWKLYGDYHAGGYAKIDKETLEFSQKFTEINNINLDKIYTAKSFYAAYDLIKKRLIPAGSRLVILHTGGLQGGIIEP